MACFGEGSVRMIKYTISMTHFTPMGDITSGNVISFD
jgi:hypothetical protein